MSEKEETFGTLTEVDKPKEGLVCFDLLDIDAGDIDAGIDQEMEIISEATTSLEQYKSLLQQAGLDGISGQAAAIMRVGLERLDHRLKTKSPLTVAVENYSVNGPTARQIVRISLEFMNDQIRALAHRARELFVRMLQVAKEKAEEVTKGVHVLKSMSTKVRENMRDAPGPNDPGTGRQRVVRVDATKIAFLYTDDKFLPANILRLRPLVDLIVNKYPDIQLKRFTKLAELITEGKSIDDLHEWAENDMGTHEGYDYSAKLPGGATFGDSGFVVEPSESVPGEWACRALTESAESQRFAERLLGDLDGLPEASTKLTRATGLVMKALTSGKEVSSEVNAFGLQQVQEAIKLNAAVQSYVIRALNAYLTMLVAETNPIGVSSFEWYTVKR